MLRPLNALLGFRLRASDGETGRIDDVYFDDHRWAIRYLVGDARHWLRGRRVLVSPISVLGVDWVRGKLNLELTRDQIRDSPDIDTDKPVARQHEIAFHEYFAFPFYWTGGDLWGTVPYPASLRGGGAPPPAQAAARAAPSGDGDPHLRSARVVRGHIVRAVDGDVGHVEDFLIDDLTWQIRYVVVEARGWPSSRHVPVPIDRIAWVSWLELTVHLDLTREAVLHAPVCDPSGGLYPDEDRRLLAHYAQPAR